MTEAEWDACDDPAAMLGFLRGRASIRKFRLFAAGCCRRIESLILKSKLGYRAVVLAERLADAVPFTENIAEFRERLWDEGFSWIDGYRQEKENNVINHAANAAYCALQDECAFYAPGPYGIQWPQLLHVHAEAAAAAAHWQRRNDRDRPCEKARRRELTCQALLIRDVFGNPFRPVAIDPSLLAWNDGTVPKIAQVIYDDRAYDRLPLLADALEDAGCADEAILRHCRESGAHVRGCWVVDVLLGKS